MHLDLEKQELPTFRLSKLVSNISQAGGSTHLFHRSDGLISVYSAEMDPLMFLPIIKLVGVYEDSVGSH